MAKVVTMMAEMRTRKDEDEDEDEDHCGTYGTCFSFI